MKTKYLILLLMAIAIGSNSLAQQADNSRIMLTDRMGWGEIADVADFLLDADDIVESENIRLSFFGWSERDDYRFNLKFDENLSYSRCILEYEMKGWNKGPADWDMLTEIQVLNPQDSLWYELARCITPYGGSFKSDWSRKYFFDVTEYLPLLQRTDSAEFKIYYGGFDATSTKAHAVQLRFHLFEGEPTDGPVLYTARVYDSFSSGNNGYRAWAYGVEGHSIEAPERMGEREIPIPEGVHSAWLRVCYSGHGQEALDESGNGNAKTKPYFPNRPGYVINNPAEFDYNTYTVILHGDSIEQKGMIWEENGDLYKQAGTYKYDRAGWGPGKPCNVHWWYLENLPAGGTLHINFDLEEYVSNRTAPNAAYVANYYVSATLFGLGQETNFIPTVKTEAENRQNNRAVTLDGRPATDKSRGIIIKGGKKILEMKK